MRDLPSDLPRRTGKRRSGGCGWVRFRNQKVSDAFHAAPPPVVAVPAGREAGAPRHRPAAAGGRGRGAGTPGRVAHASRGIDGRRGGAAPGRTGAECAAGSACARSPAVVVAFGAEPRGGFAGHSVGHFVRHRRCSGRGHDGVDAGPGGGAETLSGRCGPRMRRPV